MFKLLAPLAVALLLSGAGSASAASVAFYGSVNPGDPEAGSPEGYIFTTTYEDPTQLVSPPAFGSVELPNGKFRFDYTGPAPISGAVGLLVARHYEVFDADGNELFGNHNEATTLFDLSSPASRITMTPTGFYGYGFLPRNGRSYEEGAYVDNGYWGYLGLELIMPPVTAGASYSLKVTALPEPTTWAVMIIGFGLVGASLRSRQGNLAHA